MYCLGEIMRRSDCTRVAALTIMLGVLASARAEVGTVVAIEGQSIRTTPTGESLALRLGSQLGLGDMLEVKSGNLKIALTDKSEMVLASRSLLRLDEAQFKDLKHRRFSAWLFVGSLWARVKKGFARSDAKFEVVTDRMVARARGTTFRVDIVSDENDKQTMVHVLEGRVGVAEHSPREAGATAKPKATELSVGETMRAAKEGMHRERTEPVANESFERFIHSH
jgi:hypothetical protein